MTARQWGRALLGVCLALAATPVLAQLSIIDGAQDGVQLPQPRPEAETAGTVPSTAPAADCGDQPITIARMSWPSAELLAEIHARLLASQFGCTVQVTPGDLAATASSMGSTGQPAVAPEMWTTRVAEVWNGAITAQALRPAAPSFVETQFEGWFIPRFVATGHPQLIAAAGLAAELPTLNNGVKVRFISCPADWACAVINRNLIAAYGLSEAFQIIEPANRFEMDTLIARAVSGNEPVVFYYWRPNAVLAQFDFLPLDMGEYSEEAAKCLARLVCETPVPSAFADETVVVALSEWVFTDVPTIAAYFQRASMPMAAMNTLLAQLNEPGASVGAVADRFVAERADIWGAWIGSAAL